jgi:hypothetical protein
MSKTNADPWSRRRSHAGGLIQAGNGAGHRNFELVVQEGDYCRQYYYEYNQATWNKLGRFGDIFQPGDADFGAQPAMSQTTFNRNFEFINLRQAGGAGAPLRHWTYIQRQGVWGCSTPFGFGPSDAEGLPGFVQSNRGTPGDFEVVMRTSGGQLAHWSRQNGTAHRELGMSEPGLPSAYGAAARRWSSRGSVSANAPNSGRAASKLYAFLTQDRCSTGRETQDRRLNGYRWTHSAQGSTARRS